MDPKERLVWTTIVAPNDLDQHLENIGQAKTNAVLIQQMLSDFQLPKEAKLLFVGAGTGQMFDHISPSSFIDWELTFTDINEEFLHSLKKRLQSEHDFRATVKLDDIEETSLTGTYEGVALVLVLLHTDWKKALENIFERDPSRIYIIEQKNLKGAKSINLQRNLPPTIERASKILSSHLVDIDAMQDFISAHGYTLLKTYEKPVPDDKVMVGMVFASEIKKTR